MSTSSTRTVILVGTDSDDLVLNLRINSIPISQCHFAAVAESLAIVNGESPIVVSHLPASIATTEEKALKALIQQVEAFLRTRPTTL